MGALFHTPKLPEAQRAPTITDPAAEEARRAALLAAAKTQGRASTILNPGGVPGAAPVSVMRLGGS